MGSRLTDVSCCQEKNQLPLIAPHHYGTHGRPEPQATPGLHMVKVTAPKRKKQSLDPETSLTVSVNWPIWGLLSASPSSPDSPQSRVKDK